MSQDKEKLIEKMKENVRHLYDGTLHCDCSYFVDHLWFLSFYFEFFEALGLSTEDFEFDKSGYFKD